jgi:hypothetical protein
MAEWTKAKLLEMVDTLLKERQAEYDGYGEDAQANLHMTMMCHGKDAIKAYHTMGMLKNLRDLIHWRGDVPTFMNRLRQKAIYGCEAYSTCPIRNLDVAMQRQAIGDLLQLEPTILRAWEDIQRQPTHLVEEVHGGSHEPHPNEL